MRDLLLVSLPVLIALAWLVVIVLLLRGLVEDPRTFLRDCWDEMRLLFTEDPPACPGCGAPAKLLGRAGPRRWFYCGCGAAWPEEPVDGEAVAS